MVVTKEKPVDLIHKLEGVHSATVVTDEGGGIEAVCVVADISCCPKWIVRSVNNIFTNAMGIWLRYHKIHVVLMSRKDYEGRAMGKIE